MTVAISFWEFERSGEDASIDQKIFNDRDSAFRWLFVTYVWPRILSSDLNFCLENGEVTVSFAMDENEITDFDDLVSLQNWEAYVKAYFEFANNIDMQAGYDVVETPAEGIGSLLDKLEEADSIIVDDTFFWNFSLNLEDEDSVLELTLNDDDIQFTMEDLINAVYIKDDKTWVVEANHISYYFRPVKITEF